MSADTHDDSTGRTRVRRHPERGSEDRALIYGILDEGLVGHVGFVAGGLPYVLPMGYGRAGDRLILHGSVASRIMGVLATGTDACVTVTLLDGLVLARSTFSHSMNYRSVVCFGRARPLRTAHEKRQALDVLVEHLVPGRSRDARGPTDKELDATSVLEFTVDEASAKVRSGPPKDPAHDLHLPVWAGVIPLRTVAGIPERAPDVPKEIATPGYVAGYGRPTTG